jgi:hypothetical protein
MTGALVSRTVGRAQLICAGLVVTCQLRSTCAELLLTCAELQLSVLSCTWRVLSCIQCAHTVC